MSIFNDILEGNPVSSSTQPNAADLADALNDLSTVTEANTRDASTATAVAGLLSDGEISIIAGRAYKKDSTATGSASATNDLGVDGLVPAKEVASIWHFASDFTTTGTDAALAAGIAWLNSGTSRCLEIRGNLTISAAAPAITASGAQIDMTGAKVTVDSSAGTLGTIFTFGNSSTTASNVRIVGGWLNFQNTPDDTKPIFYYRNCTDVVVAVEQVDNGAMLARFGNSSTKASRVTLRVDDCQLNNGGGARNNILIEAGTNIVLKGNVYASADSSGSATGAIVRIQPPSGQIVDTVIFENFRCQFYEDLGAGPVNGKPYCLDIDMTNGKATNVWVIGGNFDHSTVYGIQVRDGSGSTDAVRMLMLLGVRITPDTGVGVRLKKNSASSVDWAGFRISDCAITIRDDSAAVEVIGDGYQTCILDGNTILEASLSIAKTRAVLMKSDGWSVTGNSIGPTTNPGASVGLAVGVEIDAGVNEILVHNNRCHPLIATPVKEPTYTSSSTARFVSWPKVKEAAVPDVTMSATIGSLPTPDGSVTFADAASPTNAELLEAVVELEKTLGDVQAALRSQGLIET